MAGLGRKVFTAGEVLQAADVNNYLMDQAVQVYAGTAARGSALGTSVSEGQVVYLSDTNSLEVYDGSQWGQVSQVQSPNYIINGAFEINQRGFSSATTNGVYTFDRFITRIGGDGTATFTPQTFSPAALNVTGFGESANYLRIVTAGATANNTLIVARQLIEDVRNLAGQTVTLSFWAKAGSGTPKIATPLTQNFGSGGSTSVTTPAASAVTLSTSWARYSTTITLPSISGKTIGAGSSITVNLAVSVGSDFAADHNAIGIQNNTFEIWGVQLEAGSVATPFRRAANTLQGELAACQRYYIRYTNDGATAGRFALTSGAYISSTAADIGVGFQVRMRTLPTSLDYGGTIGLWEFPNDRAVTTLALTSTVQTVNQAYIRANVASGGVAGKFVHLEALNDANSFIGFSAEL